MFLQQDSASKNSNADRLLYIFSSSWPISTWTVQVLLSTCPLHPWISLQYFYSICLTKIDSPALWFARPGPAAATRIVKVWQPTLRTFNCLQQWLEKHGTHITVFRLNRCNGAALTALPCAQLQDLVLVGGLDPSSNIKVSSRVWSDIAAATKLTSVVLSGVYTESQQEDVLAALTALPNLQQLTWTGVDCSGEQQLSDSLLLQQLTKLTALDIEDASAEALEHLCSLTKLQDLYVIADSGWAAAGCPGLQELTALVTLGLCLTAEDIPASVCQLPALQQLIVWRATPTSLNGLTALTGLTRLYVQRLDGLSIDTPPLQLPRLENLVLAGWQSPQLVSLLPMSFLASCTQLRFLKLSYLNPCGPGSLVASTMLQHLVLDNCNLSAADGAAGGPVPWQQVFPGPGRLPHLTSLQLSRVQPELQQADKECVVACCSSLQELQLSTLQDRFASALAQLSGLTRLTLEEASDGQCGALAQLTGLRELIVQRQHEVSAAGLRQLAALEQLTSLGFVDSPPNNVRGFSRVLQKPTSESLPYYAHAIVNQAPAGHPSDVPARLRQMCDLAAAGDS